MGTNLVVIGAVLLLASSTLILVFGATVRTFVDIALLSAVLGPLIIKRIPALYLLLLRAWFWTLNTSATWDLSIRCLTQDKIGASNVANALVSWSPAESNLISAASHKAIVRLLGRFVVEIDTPELPTDIAAGDRSEINVAVMPVSVGYRDARRSLDHELLPVLGALKDHTQPEWVSYSLRVQLPHQNPYFGLFVQQLELDAVTDLRIQLEFPSHAGTAEVVIRKDRMTVTAPSLESLRTASASALAFRVPEALHG